MGVFGKILNTPVIGKILELLLKPLNFLGIVSGAKRKERKDDPLYYQSRLLENQKKMMNGMKNPQLKGAAQMAISKQETQRGIAGDIIKQIQSYDMPDNEKQQYYKVVRLAANPATISGQTEVTTYYAKDITAREGNENSPMAKTLETEMQTTPQIAKPLPQGKDREELTTYDIIQYLKYLLTILAYKNNPKFDTNNPIIKDIMDFITERDKERAIGMEEIFKAFEGKDGNGVIELMKQLQEHLGSIAKAIEKKEIVVNDRIVDAKVRERLEKNREWLSGWKEIEETLKNKKKDFNERIKTAYAKKQGAYPSKEIEFVMDYESALYKKSLEILNDLVGLRNKITNVDEFQLQRAEEMIDIFSFDKTAEDLSKKLKESIEKTATKTQEKIQETAKKL